MTKAVFATALSLVSLNACLQTQSGALNYEISNNTDVETPSPTPYRTVLKDGGWEIPGLKNSVSGKKVSRSDDPRVGVTRYIPGYIRGKPPVLAAAFFTDDERRTLLIFPRPYDLVVNNLVAYDFKGKTFCYMITVNPEGIGANNILYFYDFDGDGRFETVRTHSDVYMPELPDWAK